MTIGGILKSLLLTPEILKIFTSPKKRTEFYLILSKKIKEGAGIEKPENNLQALLPYPVCRTKTTWENITHNTTIG